MAVFDQITMDRLVVGVVARRAGIAHLTPGARKNAEQSNISCNIMLKNVKE